MMIEIPRICQTIVCILIPTMSANYRPNNNSRDSNRNLQPFNLTFTLQQVGNANSVNSIASGSYAETFLEKLASKNEIVRTTLNMNKDSVENKPQIPFIQQYLLLNQQQNKQQETKKLNSNTEKPAKIYGEGTESRFPPFFEFVLQRIQRLFSVYKYIDLSRPARLNNTLVQDAELVPVSPIYNSPEMNLNSNDYIEVVSGNGSAEEGDFITVGDETEI